MNDPPASPEILEERYERGLRSLFWRLRPADLQAAIEQRMATARRRIGLGEPAEEKLASMYEAAREEAIEQLLQRAEREGGNASSPRAAERKRAQLVRILEEGIPAAPLEDAPDFDCDAGLGGMARWLRAAGYDAAWWPGIDDDELLNRVAGTTSVLLTTDRRLAERGVIARGAVAGLLVPLGPNMEGQWRFVAEQFALPRKSPRCMKCGGRLEAVDKHDVREQIPPRTWPWRDEYYRCQRCGKLFWEGTHWERIARGLETM